ncbi:glyoxalase [Amylibacter cionae]|nr:glyoxalase [Amylibacter cionae]
MAVLRIMPDIACDDPAKAEAFYGDIIGMEVLMDMKWIKTLGGGTAAKPQISFMTQGGNDTPVPDISIEVDNLDEVLERCTAAGHQPVYGPAKEDWGVRRFFVHDPFGTLLNVLQHIPPD